MADHPRILIAGGGTGGHLFPALALGEQILSDKPNSSVYFMGSTFGIEAQVLPCLFEASARKALGKICFFRFGF